MEQPSSYTSAFTSCNKHPMMKVVSVSISPTSLKEKTKKEQQQLQSPSPSSSSGFVVVDCEEKEQIIQSCLQGRSSNNTNNNNDNNANDKEEELVDLWQLRQLALLPGGLLCPSLRKSAWPKLTGVCDALFLPDQSQQQSSTTLVSRNDIQAMQQDIPKTIWNIKHECYQSQIGQEPYWFQPFAAPLQRSGMKKAVSFALDDEVEDSPEVTPSPTSVSTVDDNDVDHKNNNSEEVEEASLESTDSDEPGTSGGIGTPHQPSYSSSKSNNGEELTSTLSKRMPSARFFASSTSPKIQLQPQKPTPQELSMLHNIIEKVLQRSTLPYQEDVGQQEQEPQQLHYPKGLSNVAALLLINLESGSLTSLLLSQLASFQLNQAFHLFPDNDRNTSSSYTMNLLSNLLRIVDHDLYISLQHQTNSNLLPSFLMDSTNLWFTKSYTNGNNNRQVNNVHVASRLLDVLLVSHTLMPIYLTAAFLKHPITSDNGEVDDDVDIRTTMTQLERVIATALSYM